MAGRQGLGLLASALARRAQLASLCRLPHGLQVAGEASAVSRCWAPHSQLQRRSASGAACACGACMQLLHGLCINASAFGKCLRFGHAPALSSQTAELAPNLKPRKIACQHAWFCAEVMPSTAARGRARRSRCCAARRRRRPSRAAPRWLLRIRLKPALRLRPTPRCAWLRLLPCGPELTAATACIWRCARLSWLEGAQRRGRPWFRQPLLPCTRPSRLAAPPATQCEAGCAPWSEQPVRQQAQIIHSSTRLPLALVL